MHAIGLMIEKCVFFPFFGQQRLAFRCIRTRNKLIAEYLLHSFLFGDRFIFSVVLIRNRRDTSECVCTTTMTAIEQIQNSLKERRR